jgi:hypothetical protein
MGFFFAMDLGYLDPRPFLERAIREESSAVPYRKRFVIIYGFLSHPFCPL